MKIFLISPVRNISWWEKLLIQNYVSNLEHQGHEVHWPLRNTDQENDAVGIRVCKENRRAMHKADEIHIWWNEKSLGSIFDFGEVFGLRKKIVLANKWMVRRTKERSFNNMLLEIDKIDTMSDY